ncbi:MAG TPA: hypothetical protein PKH28_04470, partial [Candidatus Competibacteraceae bacterium]|nr:hypothetical protein [Candidatus Competibacteraceae bacterium]
GIQPEQDQKQRKQQNAARGQVQHKSWMIPVVKQSWPILGEARPRNKSRRTHPLQPAINRQRCAND